jgi:hypothetical protein
LLEAVLGEAEAGEVAQSFCQVLPVGYFLEHLNRPQAPALSILGAPRAIRDDGEFVVAANAQSPRPSLMVKLSFYGARLIPEGRNLLRSSGLTGAAALQIASAASSPTHSLDQLFG